MRPIKYLLTLTMIVNSAAASAGPKESAQIAIQQSHSAARTRAGDLLREDVNNLIQQWVFLAKNPSLQAGPSMVAQIEQMNQRIKDQLDLNKGVEKIDIAELIKLANSYERLVRDRFQTSFNVQDLVTQKHLAFRAFELPFEGFAALCRSGRSAVNVIGVPDVIPRIPNAEFTIFVGTGPDPVRFDSNNPTEDSRERNKVQAGLLAATSVSGGITAAVAGGVAVAGASSTAVIMTMAAAPYIAAAYLAYAVINAMITNDEALALQNEAAAANFDLFHKSANDRDVARYYTESCNEAMNGLQPVYEMIRDFKVSDEKRNEISEMLKATREGRLRFQQEAQQMLPAQSLIGLADLIERKKCDDPIPGGVCSKSGTVYTLSGVEGIKIDVASELDRKRVAEAQMNNKAFNEKYPSEMALKYHAHAAMDSVFENWDAVSLDVQKSSFQATDQLMSQLAQKLRYYIIEIQRARNSSWARSVKLFGAEQKLQDEFFSLRIQYFQLMTNALKIFFNRADPVKGKAQLQVFVKRFNAFAAQTTINPEVQSMNESVQKLKKFYEKL